LKGKVNKSTFSGNSAIHRGGGIDSQSTLEVNNSAFSGNSGGVVGGGGINNDGTLTVTNSTLSGNSAGNGGGIRNFFGTTATLKNTIVANSTSGGNCHNNDSAPVTDGGYNIEDGTSCGFNAANNSRPDTDPLLDPNGLQNNRGPTQTIRLLKGSPAINAIPKATNGCGTEITTDQRGVNRPQGKGCDIGAFERKKRR
jgi:predicted outer membrane repeat protein